jgi:hypothetical protein
MRTIWKDIEGYEGVYQVSNTGKVKSFKCGGERILNNNIGGTGYFQVAFSMRGKCKSFKVHKLIQSAFNMGDGHIDHIDGNKLNNLISNLRVVTHRQNMQNLVSHRAGQLVGASRRENRKPSFMEYVRGARGGERWGSRIFINGKKKHLGIFSTELEAHTAYIKQNNLLLAI